MLPSNYVADVTDETFNSKVKESDYIDTVIIESGHGVYLKLTNGKTLLDLTSGATVANLGHGNKKIAHAVLRQAKLIENTYLFKNLPRERYKELLIEEVNKGLGVAFYGDVIFLSSGSEIIDCAIKAAMRFTGKKRIISTTSSFHGRTLNCMELTQLSFSNIIQKKERCIFFQYPSNKQEEAVSLSQLETILSSYQDIAAVILEPYQGDGGLLFPKNDFFITVSSLCRSKNVLFILDEMQSGFGRTGSLFYFQQLGFVPDIICAGKGIANGMPASALISTKRIISSLNIEHISNSFGGNPLSMAAASEVLRQMQKKGFYEKVNRKGNLFKKLLEKIQKKYPLVKDVRGVGLILGIALDNTRVKDIGKLFCERCYESGLLIMPPKGAGKNVIKISPPLVINEREIKQAALQLEKVIDSFE